VDLNMDLPAMSVLLLSVAALIAEANAESDDKVPPGSQYSYGVMVGIAAGCIAPIIMVNAFSDVDNSPPSNIDELTGRNFFEHVGNDKPAVVLFHEYNDADCQEFRWTFEEIFEHFETHHRNKILFATVDQSVEQSLAKHFGTQLKGSPTLLWFAPGSRSPVFYSSSLMEARVEWICTWITKRHKKGSVGDNRLIGVEQLIAEIYHWFDGYDCSETEQIALDNAVEEKSWIGRLVTGHEASVYGEVLPDGVQTLLDCLEKEMPLSNDDVFVDLGSGTGKVVVHAAVATPCKKSIGIELSETRFNHGLRALEEAQKTCQQRDQGDGDSLCLTYAQKLVDAQRAGRVDMRHGDITVPTYNDATHLFAASTTWPDALLEAVLELAVQHISDVKTLSTLRPMPSDVLRSKRGVVNLWKTIDVAVSWQDTAPMYVYKFRKNRQKKEN